MINYEIKQDEINGSNRVVVVEVGGEDWEGDKTLRIQVNPTATKEDVKQSVEATLEEYRLGKEIENNLDQLREKDGSPAGESGEINLDAKNLVDKHLNEGVPLRRPDGRINKEAKKESEFDFDLPDVAQETTASSKK